MKKLTIALILIAGLTYASVLDTNDLKITNMQGLGGNPAAIAVNKKASIEVGSAVMSRLSHNSKLLSFPVLTTNPLSAWSKVSGSNINPSSFSDAPKFFKYTGAMGKDNWFSVRYFYDSNVYPFAGQKQDANSNNKYTYFQKDATETLSLIFSKEIAKDLIGGIELGSNTYTSETKIDYAKDVGVDIYAFSNSKPYYSLQLGLIKIIDANNKFTFAHKFSQNRGLYVRTTGGDTYTDTEAVPNETSLGYVYNANKNLELGAYYKMTWGTSYTTNKKGADTGDDQNHVTKHPFNNLTLVADYKLNDRTSLQGYYVYIRNYKQIEYINASKATNDDMDRGWKVNQLGGNVQYKVTPADTLLLGSYISKLISEDTDVNWIIDQTVTHISYNHML